MQKTTKELALCGIMAALAVVLLCLGGMLPFAVYACPMLASLVFIPVGRECRKSYAWSCFAASAILGLLLGPDKECSMLFCVLGYYPLIYPKLQRIGLRTVRYAVKLILFAAAVAVMYAVILYVFAIPEAIAEFAESGTLILAATVIVGIVAFFAYDVAAGRMINAYEVRRKRIKWGIIHED